MIHPLDASHKCVLNHWAAITQMNECRSQAEAHLKDVSRQVLKTLHTGHRHDFEPHEDIGRESWFQFYPHTVRKWNGTGHPLIGLGIENLEVQALLNLGDERCVAYVFSPYRAEKTIINNATDRLVSIPPPPGFTLEFDVAHRGYIFVKELPALSVDEFCDMAKLEQHLTDPLLTLMDWYRATEPTILSVLEKPAAPAA